MCVCVCMCVCLKHLCRSGSDWPEIFNMAAAWFRGVQRWICLDYNVAINNLFHKWFMNSASIVNHSHHSHMRTKANHCRAHPHAPPPESMNAPLLPNHVTNLRWRSSKTLPPWVLFPVLLPFLLVEKGTTPTNHKIIWQTTRFGCWGRGQVVGGTTAKEWQQQWWWYRQW